MNKIYVILILILLYDGIWAEEPDSVKIQKLEKRILLLEGKMKQNELDQLKEQAESLSQEKEKSTGSKTFKGGQRALQALNPEISVASDAFGQFIGNRDLFTRKSRSGAHFRVAEVQFQSTLDPFSMNKVIIEFKPDAVEFAEAYLTWSGLLPNISLTAGKFRQQFGVVNRWHAHALDQFDFPLALTTILGDEGLNQLGLSLDLYLGSILSSVNNLTVQITNGQNEQLFAGEQFSFPTGLFHYKNYRDISRDTYFEFGLTGMLGENNLRGFEDGIKKIEPRRLTKLGGADLTVLWEPVERSKYRYLLWRSEIYYVNKEILNGKTIEVFGGYSYIEQKFRRRWLTGVRLDYTQPFQLDNSDQYIYQLVPYITFWQSEWVRLRLQYNYLNGKDYDDPEHTVRFQITWAMGPHKHERY